MYIYKEPNPSGSYPALLENDFGDCYYFPPKFIPLFYQAQGFVELTIENDKIIDVRINETALAQWKSFVELEQNQEEKNDRIQELKKFLADTDYIACKIAEDAATREEYADVIAQRQAWRDEINELETQ